MITADVLQSGVITIRDGIVSDSVLHQKIKFSFPDDWKGYTKTAIFKNGDNSVGIILNGDDALCTGEDECYIPFEVIKAPEFTVSVFGVKGDSVATSARTAVKVLKSGYGESDKPQEPTPDQYSQLIALSEKTREIAQSVRDDADNGVFNGDNSEVDKVYTPTSNNAQSGKAVAEGIDLNVGVIGDALALIVEGSKTIPQSLLNKLGEQAGEDLVEKLKPYADVMIQNKLSEITGEDRHFKTSVKRLEAGEKNLKVNTIYGVIVVGDSVPQTASETGSGEETATQNPLCGVSAFDSEGQPITIKGKMVAVVVGNYGDNTAQKADAFIGGYKSLAVKKGMYTVLGDGMQGKISWNTTAIVIEIALGNEG